MCAEDACSRGAADAARLLVCRGLQDSHRRLAAGRNQDLDVRAKQRVQPFPVVGYHRGRTCAGFEQTHRRGPAGGNHVRARHVQREARGGIEFRMRRRRQMLHALDIRRPVYGRGILRAGNHEPTMRQAPSRLQQQPFERRLPVGAVGAKIGEVPAFGHVERRVRLGVDGAVKGARDR